MTTQQIGHIVPAQLAGTRYAVPFLGANVAPRPQFQFPFYLY